jgi:hypothetical protein
MSNTYDLTQMEELISDAYTHHTTIIDSATMEDVYLMNLCRFLSYLIGNGDFARRNRYAHHFIKNKQ